MNVRSLTAGCRQDAPYAATLFGKAVCSLGWAVGTLANEISRLSDRLTRARERTWSGASSLLLPVRGSREARREPKRVPSAHDREREREARTDAGAEKKRPAATPTTLVAIHVEVRHPSEPGSGEDTARFVEAQVDDVAAAHQHEFAIEDERAAPVDLAYEVDSPAPPVFALPAPGSTGTYNRQGRVGGAVRYLAQRAVSAYLAQQTFASGGAHPPQRLIDIRA